MGNPAKPSSSPEKVEVDLSFRLLDRADISEQEVSRVLEFLHQAFGGWPHYDPGVPLADYLRWKMESPATPLAAAVGEHNGELAVFTLFLTQRILIRGREGLLLRYVDLAVGEDYRGLGVPPSIRRAVEREEAFSSSSASRSPRAAGVSRVAKSGWGPEE